MSDISKDGNDPDSADPSAAASGGPTKSLPGLTSRRVDAARQPSPPLAGRITAAPPDPFGENLTATAATLTDILDRLATAIKAGFESASGDVKHLGRLPSALDNYGRLLRQLSSLGQLKARLEEKRSDSND